MLHSPFVTAYGYLLGGHCRQLAKMSNGTAVWNYSYDANGMRTSRTDGTTTYTYVYNGGLLMQMTVGEHVLEFAYDASGTPMTVTLNGVTYYYLTNIQGDVVSIIDGNGALVAHYTYDAWGNPNAGSSHSAIIGHLNPLRYRGYVYDQEIGLYYLQSRYYSPKTGRFLNADAYISTGGLLGYNMFAYCGNNPVMYTDPFGYGIWEDICDYLAWCGEINNQQRELDTQIRLQKIELIGNGVSSAYNSYNESIIRQQEVDTMVTQGQVEVVKKGLSAGWDAYMRGYNLQQEAQLLDAQATIDAFSTPERTSQTLSYIGQGFSFLGCFWAGELLLPFGAGVSILAKIIEDCSE